jgi:hypothetical protein
LRHTAIHDARRADNVCCHAGTSKPLEWKLVYTPPKAGWGL